MVGVRLAGDVRAGRRVAGARGRAAHERTELLTGWSRTAPTAATLVERADPADVDAGLARAGRRGLIARGLGRSYGDAAQNAGGIVLDATTLAGFHEIDVEQGVIRVDAGVSLEAIMRTMVPAGLVRARHAGHAPVTVGGAIAADVHGKSHHFDGSFSNHVESFVLHTPKGTRDGHPRVRRRAVLGHRRRARPHRRDRRGDPPPAAHRDVDDPRREPCAAPISTR